MNPDASWWDEFVGANAIAMGWYQMFRGQPVPSYTGQVTQGGAVSVGPGGVGAQLTTGALVAIVVVILAVVLLLRK